MDRVTAAMNHPPTKPTRTRRRFWIGVIVLVLASLMGWQIEGRRPAASPAAATAAPSRRGRGGVASVPVVVATATTGNIPVYLRGLGTVTALNTVVLHTRISGQILNVFFREGQMVTKGERLAAIDPRPYEVALQQATANLAQAKGNLARDEANRVNAVIEYQRYDELTKKGILSREQFDQQKATTQGADAALEADKAAIQSNEAALQAARLNLVYCSLTAPLSGRIGLRQVDPGNYVQPSDSTGLAVITQTQPITAVFNLPQDSLQQVYAQLRAGKHLAVEAWDQNNTARIATGTLLTIDNAIDTATGTYRLKAVFDNADNALFPNQFVNIRLLEGVASGLTIVPPAAIQRGPQGTYVFTVDRGTAKMQAVDVKLTEGGQAGVDRGLASGTRVVVDGADKLENGTSVRVATGSDAGGQ